MKIAILGDCHFGMRNDSNHFLDFNEKFYKDVFFPALKREKISSILQLGDLFDRRKYINFHTLKRSKQMFFDICKEEDINLYVLAGNHDTYWKNTNEVNSPDLLLKEYTNVTVIDKPSHIWLGDDNFICMMPWICADNYDESLHFLKNSQAQICCGHFEISGFAMYRGMTSSEGLNRDVFKKFSRVFSGHYHHKSYSENIHYVGTPVEMTWQDYNDSRGFHIFNLEDHELTFIENPNRMFHRIVYDDKTESISDITNKDVTEYTNTYVKVVVVNKTNPYLFDKFMNKLYNVNPIDINIVEDFTELTEGVDEEMVDQAQDTITILNKYVDTIQDDSIDNAILKNILQEVYVEALNIETA